ncbi:MAG: hypothetical protein V4501_03660 [Pseudomonadota bacterium]
MNSNTVSVFNQFFFFSALLGLVISLICYTRFSHKISNIVRLSLIGASFFALIVSILPSLALLLTISFVPSVISQAFDRLHTAAIIAWPLGFAASFCLLALVDEFFNVLNRNNQKLQFRMMVMAIIVIAAMVHLMGNGYLDYKIIFKAEEILNYAALGTNPSQLEKIYMEVAISHDANLFNQLLIKLAGNPHTSAQLLRVVYARTLDTSLTDTQRNFIFASLSKNPHAASDLLKKLLVTISQNVQAQPDDLSAVSHNLKFTQDALLQLIAYPDCEIRRAIIGYPNVSENILTKIIEHDPDVGVRRDAKRRLDFLHGISHLDTDNRSTMNPNNKIIAPAEKIADPLQLAAIYKNLDINDDPDEVLASLAENCHITKDMARDIYAKASGKKGYARTAVFIALSINPQTPADILNFLANEKELAILRALAANPHIPYEIIDRFAPYPDCRIRKEIICLPSASTSVLKKLRDDTDESVAQEASERLRAENSYLDICREFRKITPSCSDLEGAPVAPEMRVYPNTSERKALDQPLASND